MPDRKTPDEKIAALEARATVLKNRIAQLKARKQGIDRKQDARRKIIIGGTVLAEMQENEKFCAFMAGLLKKRVTRKNDQDVIADLLQTEKQRGTSGEPSLPV